MATHAPARALRAALSQSARPALSSSLYTRPAPLLAAAAPFARQPSLLLPSLRSSNLRGFASSAPRQAWLPWAKDKKDVAVDKVTEVKDAVEDKAAALSSSSSSSEPAAEATAVSPAPEPTIVSTAPSDVLTSTPPPVPALEGNFYDGIFTGSLDLTSLSGAWGPHPIMRLQSLFLHLHESFPLVGHGLAWCILIPTVTVFLRMLLFPFQARANANAARMAIIQPEMLKGMNKLKEAKARNDFTGMQAAQLEVQHLMKSNNVNPIRNLAFPLAQASVFMCMFFALRGLANAGLPSMATEGAAWFTDLTTSDPYYVLPVASTALTLATLETGVDQTTTQQTSTTKNMKAIFRVMLVLALPFIAYFPAALLLYWTTNNFLSLCQTQLLKLPAVRSFLNIPTPPPKPQPGEPGYVAEPSFAEAFKNMQTGMKDKWDETAREAEKKAALEARFKAGANAGQAEVFTPKQTAAPARVRGLSQAAEELLATGTTAAQVIEAQPAGAQEQERARRVAEARRRRLGRK